MKRLGWILLLILVAALLAGCAAQPPAATPSATPAETAQSTGQPTAAPTQAPQATATPAQVTLPTFTAEELAKYTGQDGSRAYIAVGGKVYDVTDVPQWKNGSHAGRFQAGVDWTDALAQAPHSASMLDGVPIVGMYSANQ